MPEKTVTAKPPQIPKANLHGTGPLPEAEKPGKDLQEKKGPEKKRKKIRKTQQDAGRTHPPRSPVRMDAGEWEINIFSVIYFNPIGLGAGCEPGPVFKKMGDPKAYYPTWRQKKSTLS